MNDVFSLNSNGVSATSVSGRKIEGFLRRNQERIQKRNRDFARKFMDALNKDQIGPFNRLKVMFVGQGCAGKTATGKSHFRSICAFLSFV